MTGPATERTHAAAPVASDPEARIPWIPSTGQRTALDERRLGEAAR
jgi:hypothetical protein